MKMKASELKESSPRQHLTVTRLLLILTESTAVRTASVDGQI